jgi:hypothetical protein
MGIDSAATQTHFNACPKCGQVFPESLPASAPCPACGIYLFKWGQSPVNVAAPETTEDDEGWSASVMEPMAGMDPVSFYARVAILFGLLVWSWTLIRADYRDGEIFESFMHNILLPIHEAGHIFFIPFGEFMTVLGGSLFQVALPLGIAMAFLLKNRDAFGAAIGLWWASVSLMDVSPYIYDALYPRLTLLGGHTGEDGPHDWIYLLGRLGKIPQAQHWGAVAHGFGAMVAIAALVWAAFVLVRTRQRMNRG